MVVMLPLSSMRMYAEPLVVPLEENILDPTLGQGGPQRGPETIPVVSIQNGSGGVLLDGGFECEAGAALEIE